MVIVQQLARSLSLSAAETAAVGDHGGNWRPATALAAVAGRACPPLDPLAHRRRIESRRTASAKGPAPDSVRPAHVFVELQTARAIVGGRRLGDKGPARGISKHRGDWHSTGCHPRVSVKEQEAISRAGFPRGEGEGRKTQNQKHLNQKKHIKKNRKNEDEHRASLRPTPLPHPASQRSGAR